MSTQKSKRVLRGIKEYALITLGIFSYVLGWTVFLAPNQLVGGGVTGIASIIQYATGGRILMGWSYFALNAILLVIGLATLGRSFGVKTVYAIILASIGLNVFQEIIPYAFIQQIAIDNGKLMSTIMGGLLVGFGIGTTMSQGGSTGGTDIIALLINKYHNVSPGRIILITDVIIIASSLLIPSYDKAGNLLPFVQKVTTVVYGFILVGVNSTVLDFTIQGSRQSVQLFVLSKKYQEIADFVTKELHHGVTVLDGKGWYTKENAEVLMIITRKYDLNLLLREIKRIDPQVFLSVSSATAVYGKGFETIKSGPKK